MGHVSKNVINRLLCYLRLLDEMFSRGWRRTSSTEIGEALGIKPSLVRQDFSCFGEFGLQGFGYDVLSLRESVQKTLGCDRVYTTVIVGVGNLGCALLENMNQFPTNHLFLGAFDVRPELIGKIIAGERIRSGTNLAAFIREHKVDIAILAVPRGEAQQVADEIISAGVRAILNFTNVELYTASTDVVVENVHFSDSFHMLSYHLSHADSNQENVARC